MTKEAAIKLESGKRADVSPKEEATTKQPKFTPRESFEPPPLLHAVLTYISYAILFIFGHIADFLRRLGIKKDLNVGKDANVSVIC